MPIVDEKIDLEDDDFVKVESNIKKSYEEAKVLYDSDTFQDKDEAKSDGQIDQFDTIPEGSPLDIDNPAWDEVI